jgi:hypothetical protein
MINCLPDEVLLEVFDSYRQFFDDHQYDNQWRKKYAWFNLVHVCRRWRAVVFASCSRLDLNIVVGPEKPDQIKTILSRSFNLPILVDYSSRPGGRYRPRREITGSVLWRMRAALRDRDRVREIFFGEGWPIDFTRELFNATNHPFPALESLILCFPFGQKPYIPATFLRGSDHSDLPLRRLKLYGVSLASVSGFLLFATALTDLTLNVPFSIMRFESCQSRELFLACLQGMQSLCSLDLTVLTTPSLLPGSEFHSTLVPLLKLTRFHYSGPGIFLNNLMSGLSAPSLQDGCFRLCAISPVSYLSRAIGDVREEFRSISVTFDMDSTQSGEISYSNLSFRFNVSGFSDSTTAIFRTPPTKLAMTEVLALNFPHSQMTMSILSEHSLREFLRQFRSVRMLRVSPLSFAQRVRLLLQQDNGEAVLPLLEEIELSDGEEYKRRAAKAVADFKPFVSARGRTGHLVKV